MGVRCSVKHPTLNHPVQSLQLEHARVQLVVASPLVDELLVVAPLDDAALLQHQYQVCIPDGGQAVGDDKDGAALHQLVHAPLDEGFGRVTFYEAGIWWICFFSIHKLLNFVHY